MTGSGRCTGTPLEGSAVSVSFAPGVATGKGSQRLQHWQLQLPDAECFRAKIRGKQVPSSDLMNRQQVCVNKQASALLMPNSRRTHHVQ